jgi:hypothetical protein
LRDISQVLMSDVDQTNALADLVEIRKAVKIGAIKPGQQKRLGSSLERLMRVKERGYFARLARSIASSVDSPSQPRCHWRQ